MSNPFESLSTDQLKKMLHDQADTCVRIVNMTEAERHVVGPKGEASPHQAGAFNAVVAMQVSRVLKSRGVQTGL